MQDRLLDEVAVVLVVHGAAGHAAHEKAGRPLDEAVGAEAFQRLGIVGRGRHDREARRRTERADRVRGQMRCEAGAHAGRDGLVAIGAQE